MQRKQNSIRAIPNCRTVILKPLVTLVTVTAFLLQGLHPFLYYPHVICKASPNQWLREDELLRPMMCTGKIPDRCIKKWVLNRWQFSNQRLCSSQQTDQMENSVCELFCSTQRYWPDCICTLVQDQEVATPDAASQTTSALFVLLFVFFLSWLWLGIPITRVHYFTTIWSLNLSVFVVNCWSCNTNVWAINQSRWELRMVRFQRPPSRKQPL